MKGVTEILLAIGFIGLKFASFQPDIKFNLILAWALRVIRRSEELEKMLEKVYHGNYMGSDPSHGQQ